MFENLKDKLQTVFSVLGKKGILTEKDIDNALSEVRIALLEADVSLIVVKEFISKIKEKALGAAVLKSVKPDQQVIKIVHDGLVEILGSNPQPLRIDGTPPAIFLMVGLQGSGKTTTSAKIALLLKQKYNKNVLLASLDTIRPAAKEQLRILSEQVDVGILPETDNETPIQLAKRSIQSAKLKGFDVVILDTAGRLSIDELMMSEIKEINNTVKPNEILLVADSLSGQDALNTAKAFNESVGISGIVLTRLDGDARGGAALSMIKATGCPVKLVGVGEKVEDLEEFDPKRVAGRILDMGDVVSLVEKAAEAIEEEEAKKMAERMASGKFDMNDFLNQIRQIKKMGGLGSIMNFLPGVGKIKKQMSTMGVDDNMIKRQEAIILSMNRKEKKHVGLLNASRRKRIASGSGTTVQEVNRLVKQYMDMSKVMKKMGNLSPSGLKGMMNSIPGFGNKNQNQLNPSDLDLKGLSEKLSNSEIDTNKLFQNKSGLPGLGGSNYLENLSNHLKRKK